MLRRKEPSIPDARLRPALVWSRRKECLRPRRSLRWPEEGISRTARWIAGLEVGEDVREPSPVVNLGQKISDPNPRDESVTAAAQDLERLFLFSPQRRNRQPVPEFQREVQHPRADV